MTLKALLDLFNRFLLECVPPLTGGSAAEVLHNAKTLKLPDLPEGSSPENAPKLKFPADGLQPMAGPVVAADAGPLGVLLRGLTFERTATAQLPRGLLGDLLYHLGPRNAGARDQGARCSTVCDKLLTYAGQYVGFPIDANNLPEFLDDTADAEVAQLVIDYLSAAALPYHLQRACGGTPLAVMMELSAREKCLEGEDEAFILRRVNYTCFPNMERVLLSKGTTSAATAAAARELARGVLGKSADKVHTEAALRLVDAKVKDHLAGLTGHEAVVDPAGRVALVLNFKASATDEQAILLATSSKGGGKDKDGGGDIFDVRHVVQLAHHTRDPRFHAASAKLHEIAMTSNHREYWGEYFVAANGKGKGGLALLLRALRCLALKKSLPATHQFYGDVQRMYVYLPQYIAFVPDAGRRRRSRGRRWPRTCLRRTSSSTSSRARSSTSTRRSCVTPLAHFKAVEMSKPMPSKLKSSPPVDEKILLAAMGMMGRLMEMYGYDKHPYGIDNVFLQAIDMVQRAPMGHEAFATAKAGEYLQTALLDGQRVVTNMLNGKDIEGMTFSPELMPPQETVLSRRVLQLFAERLKQAAVILGARLRAARAEGHQGAGQDRERPRRQAAQAPQAGRRPAPRRQAPNAREPQAVRAARRGRGLHDAVHLQRRPGRKRSPVRPQGHRRERAGGRG